MKNSRWIDSRHGFRLSKADGTATKVMCPAHLYWHQQQKRLPDGKVIDVRCPKCVSDFQDLKYIAGQLGIPLKEATRPENLKRIEERLGYRLRRYMPRG